MIRAQKQDFVKALERISAFIHRTPIIQNMSINQMVQATLYFKCENFQKTGSFKVRGAANMILQLDKTNTVCTHSSGNHAQAVAYIGKRLKIAIKVVMPKDSPQTKKNAVKEYGADIVQCGSKYVQRQEAMKQIIKNENAVYVSSSDHQHIIIGAGTVAYQFYQELLNKDVELDYIVFPIGGGGLASGSILSTKYFSPKTKTIGIEPQMAKDAYLSWKQKNLHDQLPPITVADGLRTRLGQKPFQVISQEIDDIILVSQVQIIKATKLFMERTKIIIQTSSATVLAGIIKDSRFIGKKVGAIISGGNIDLSSFFNQLQNKEKKC